MRFSGIIKLELKFFKSMQNKITKSIFYFSFILELKKKTKKNRKKKKKAYMTQKQFNSERRKKKEKKRKDTKKID